MARSRTPGPGQGSLFGDDESGASSKPAAFSSPVGTGNAARRATAAAVTDLGELVRLSDTYKRNMAAAAAAARQTAEAMKSVAAIQVASLATSRGAPAGFAPVAGGSTGNGGGAAMPVAPGGMPSVPTSMQAPAGAAIAGAAAANGGGARFSNFGAGLGAIGVAAAAGGMKIGAAAFPNMVQTDYISNRLAMTNQSYNQSAVERRMLQHSANAFLNDQDRMAGFMRLRNGGFTEDSAGFSRLAQGTRMASLLDPMRGFDRASAVQMELSSPAFFNQQRMLTGIQSINPGGGPRDIASFAQELVTRGTGSSRPMTAARLAAEAGPTGDLRLQMNQSGMSPEMQQTIIDFLDRAAQRGSYAAARREITGPGAPTGNGSDTALQLQNNQTSAEQEVITSLLQPTMDAYKIIMDTTTTATKELAQTLDRLPGAVRAVLGAGVAGPGALQGELGGGAVNGIVGGAIAGAIARGRPAISRGAAGGAGRLVGRLGLTAARGGAGLIGGGAGMLAGHLLGDRDEGWQGLLGRTLAGAATGAAIGGLPTLGVGAIPGAIVGGLGGLLSGIGDGLGHGRKEPKFGMAGWGGTSQPEMGDGDGGDNRGPDTYQYLTQLMARSGIPHRIVSTVRPNARTTSGSVSYHATGNAVDIAGPKPGKDTPEMLAINRYLAQKLGKGVKELIYSGPGGINLYNGQSHSFSGRVRSMHHDHVHVSVTEETLKKAGQAVSTSELVGHSALREANEHQAQRPGNRTKRRASRNRRGRQGRGPGGFSERKLIENFFSSIGIDDDRISTPGVDVTEAGVATEADKKSAAGVGANSSVGADAIDKFLLGLRLHESGGDYQDENPNTSASGAYQYVTSTWNRYRGYKTAGSAPPHIQDERARRDASRLYDKYGNWRMVAAAHFQGEGWLQKNPDPSTWDSRGNRKHGNPKVSSFVNDVLAQGGLPETGDGVGWMGAATASAESQVADVPEPRGFRGPGGGDRGGMRIDARRGGGIHIAKVEVHLTTPQVSQAEAARIGKMVANDIAKQARMNKMSI